MTAPDSITQLVEKFDQRRDYYTSAQYNETQVRVEFINPFFHALGWDVNDSQHVIHEAMVYVEENARMKPKHPDYAFLKSPRISGSGSPDYGFFVEAKAPHVDLRGGISPAYQVRRYGWSAKLPASVLTDFEEFSLYDCRIRPNADDNPRKDRLIYLEFADYVDHWDEIVELFSYEAVRENRLDEYVRGHGERGTSTVDDAFLHDLEAWRVQLAKHIALHNPGLTRRQINQAVQLTIDRIVFLRICEDRGIEGYGRLRDLQASPQIYPELTQFFRQADSRYNSGLFHFSDEAGRGERDDLTLTLTIPNEPLADILGGLYYPVSPYEFSVLPADILGHVYERFLGSVIELSSGGLAEVVEKPEVRKAGGVYYTPTYIVDYIVKNTVGKLLEGITPDEASKLRILDPACGSGSFLIGAYQYLMDWHLEYYVSKAPKRRVKEGVLREITPSPGPFPAGREGEQDSKSRGELYGRGTSRPDGTARPNDSSSPTYALTTAEKKRILLNNIYGVDLDQQAVEVSKLSLLLKMLEGEDAASTGDQLQLMGERLLPDLSDNIKWGNSLIGPDFYHGKQLGMFEDEELYKVKVFDWESRTDGFGTIMAKGGFDAVIGNPPYVRIQRIAHEESDYIFEKFNTPSSKTDLSQMFLEQSLNLAQKDGLIGFISTSQWMSTDYGKYMRELLGQGFLHHVVDFGSLPVFTADTYPAIFILSPTIEPSMSLRVIQDAADLNLAGIYNAKEKNISFQTLSTEPWNLGQIDLPSLLNNRSILWKPLKSYGHAYIGTLTGMDDAFVVTQELYEELQLEEQIVFPYAYRGKEVSRFELTTPSARVIYPYYEGNEGTPELLSEDALMTLYPNVYRYLIEFKERLTKRKDSRKYYATDENWFRHLRAGSFKYIRPEKLIIKGIDNKSTVGLLDADTCFNGANCPAIIPENLDGLDLLYILGLLNSKLISYHLRMVCPAKLGGYTRFNANNVNKTPIRTIDFDDAADVARHDRMVALVERMLDLHQQLADVSGQGEKIVRQQIAATDREIDALVYELYGLTDEEIAIVEAPE